LPEHLKTGLEQRNPTANVNSHCRKLVFAIAQGRSKNKRAAGDRAQSAHLVRQQHGIPEWHHK
jgi:hypothetical protein